jgi:hypothetical protein
MTEDKDRPKTVSTCFDGPPCAENLQKALGGGGIGSLCEGLLRSERKKLCGDPQGPQEAMRPAREGNAPSDPRAVRGRMKDQQNGGVK